MNFNVLIVVVDVVVVVVVVVVIFLVVFDKLAINNNVYLDNIC